MKTLIIKLKAWVKTIKNRAWALWIKAAGIRSLRTIAQTLLANVGITAAMSRSDWMVAMSAAGMAGIVSLAMSLVSLPEAAGGSNSWIKAALIRCARTIGQSVASSLAAFSLLSEVYWPSVIAAAMIAGALSMITSIAGLPEAAES